MGEYPTFYIAGLELGMTVLSLVIAFGSAMGIVELGTCAYHAPKRMRRWWIAGASVVVGIAVWMIAIAGLLAARPAVIPQQGWFGAAGLALAIIGAATLLIGARVERLRSCLFLGTAGGLAIAASHAALAYASLWRAPGFVPLPIISALLAAGAAGVGIVWVAHAYRLELGQAGVWTKRVSAAAIAIAIALLPQLFVLGLPTGPRSAPVPTAALWVGIADALWAGALVLAALVAMISYAAADRRARRRAAETEALRRSEDRFRSLAEASAQIVWTTAPDGKMSDPQPSWARFTGQTPEEYRAWGWFSAIHPDDRESSARIWEEAIANRRPIELEHRVRRHDGRYRDCIVRIVPVLERDGTVREWVGTHSDVTDRTRTREDRDILVEAGRVLSSSLDARDTLGALAALIVPRLADACSIHTRDENGDLRRVLSVHADPNRADLLREYDDHVADDENGERGLGYVLRTHQSELIRDVDDDELDSIAPDPEQRERLRQLELGSRIVVPLTARGEVFGVLTLMLDRAGEGYDLRDLALTEELGRRAAAAVDNARLHAQLQSALRGRDDVLGIVSHDLRNPLHTITMASSLLLEEDVGPEQRVEQLRTIRRSAAAMDGLIQDLLDVTRSESGRLVVEARVEPPAELLREACETVQSQADAKSVTLVCTDAGGLPPVLADRRRIVQVLSNLIGNALKFSPEGGEVRVSAGRDGADVRFSVSDDGPGIAPEHIADVFEPHWQARDTAHLGAGLGLAIARGIVDAHGGRIWAESEPGKGADFQFTLPAADADARGVEDPGGAVRMASSSAISLTKENLV